jgi:hypothetical protein
LTTARGVPNRKHPDFRGIRAVLDDAGATSEKFADTGVSERRAS